MTQVSDPPCPARPDVMVMLIVRVSALCVSKKVSAPHSSTVLLYLSSLHLNVRLYIRPSARSLKQGLQDDLRPDVSQSGFEPNNFNEYSLPPL